MKAVIDALNVTYGEKEKRGFIKLNLISLALTGGAILVLLVAIGAIVVLPLVLAYIGLVLLCHKFRCLFRAAQHGQRESVVARAATNLRRIVAIEFGTWRSGRNGGSSGLVTFA